MAVAGLEPPGAGNAVDVIDPGDTSAPMPRPGASVLLQYKVLCPEYKNKVLQASADRSVLKVPWGPGFPGIAALREVIEKVRSPLRSKPCWILSGLYLLETFCPL